MRRKFLLVMAILVGLLLVVNGTKRLLVFRTTSQKVAEAQSSLSELRAENEALKRELEYKKGEKFAEEEIRNKLGLAREGETVVLLPKESDGSSLAGAMEGEGEPNWRKWWNLFFGS